MKYLQLLKLYRTDVERNMKWKNKHILAEQVASVFF